MQNTERDLIELAWLVELLEMKKQATPFLRRIGLNASFHDKFWKVLDNDFKWHVPNEVSDLAVGNGVDLKIDIYDGSWWAITARTCESVAPQDIVLPQVCFTCLRLSSQAPGCWFNVGHDNYFNANESHGSRFHRHKPEHEQIQATSTFIVNRYILNPQPPYLSFYNTTSTPSKVKSMCASFQEIPT